MSAPILRWVGIAIAALGGVACAASGPAPAGSTPRAPSPIASSPAGVGSGAGSAPRLQSSASRDAHSTARTGGPLVESVRWVERGGRASLAVIPAARLREGPDDAAIDAAWERILALAPRAHRAGMRDQFVCHVRFAPTKAAFYLEPWRPAVGYVRTVAEACNPGERKDLG